MSFLTEKELVLQLKNNIKDIEYLTNYHLMEEVSLGLGVADLVISEIESNKINNKRKKLDIIDITIYEMLEESKTIDLKTIEESTRINRYQIKKSLAKLIENNYVAEQDNSYVLNSYYKLSFKKSIAIEAKLKNWKRALLQAYRYRWFADYSYVVLDLDYSKPALNNIEMFKNYNIGLLTISSNGIIQKHFKPKKIKPIDSSMQKLLSEAILFS